MRGEGDGGVVIRVSGAAEEKTGQSSEKGRATGKASRGESNADSPLQNANVEPATSDEPLGKGKAPHMDQRASIRVHSKRRRLADTDGVSAKAAIDALVICGVLRDDSSKYVKEVSYSQEVSQEEETWITVVWG